MKYKLFRLRNMSIMNSSFEVLEEIDRIEWSKYGRGEDDNGTIWCDFKSPEECQKTLQELFYKLSKEEIDDLSISQYDKFTCLPCLNIE
jgi:hypothetical protein